MALGRQRWPWQQGAILNWLGRGHLQAVIYAMYSNTVGEWCCEVCNSANGKVIIQGFWFFTTVLYLFTRYMVNLYTCLYMYMYMLFNSSNYMYTLAITLCRNVWTFSAGGCNSTNRYTLELDLPCDPPANDCWNSLVLFATTFLQMILVSNRL